MPRGYILRIKIRTGRGLNYVLEYGITVCYKELP